MQALIINDVGIKVLGLREGLIHLRPHPNGKYYLSLYLVTFLVL